MRGFRKRWRGLRRRGQLERDLADELRFHREMAAEDSGAPVRTANLSAAQEACREVWSFTRLETWWRDLRYAVRSLARNPGFTSVAVIALALGIGADTAMFTIVKGVLTWDLGLDRSDRVVVVGVTDSSHRQDFGVSYPDFHDLRTRVRSLSGLAAYRFVPVNVSDRSGLPERYYCVEMSANGFAVMGYQPVLGRGFTAADEQPGAPPVLVLSHHVWQERYGQDPSILGRTVRVNEVPMTVAGVMPPRRRFPEDTDLWTPLKSGAAGERRDRRALTLFGRLADGATLSTARTEVDTVARTLALEYPETNKGMTASLQPIIVITGAYGTRPLLVVMFCAVGFVLLIACADVANMLLARAAGRSREISIRFAIGAGRAHIVRQLLIESVVLACAGGLLGWLVATGGLAWFDAGTSGISRPPWLQLSFDRSVFLYMAAISIGTGILFGLAPALRLAKVDVHAALKDGGYGTAGGRRGLRLSSMLVALEMALCVVLLAGAGLMIRSALNLYGTPIGVNPAGVLTMRINLPEAKYPRPEDQAAFHQALAARLESLPGVEAAAVASNLPLGSWMSLPYELQGAAPAPGRAPRLGAIVASPAYFRVVQVKPRRGRLFTETDGVSGEPVAVVNESFAAKFWPGEDPLGKHLRLLRDRAPQAWMTVVGVAPDILQNFRQPLEHDPLIYLPYAAQPQRQAFLLARTRVPPATLATAFRGEVRQVDENLAVYEVRTLEDRIAQSRLAVKLFGAMCAVFALVALVLASIGLYSVMAHAVSQRTQEIGIRMAMGGSSSDILRLVFAQALRPLGLGLAIGLAAALGITRVLGALLAGVSPADPATFLGVAVVLIGAGVLGCAVPARRALGVDPLAALRCE